MWTKFYDMFSGGSQKEPFETIYIEAPEKEAVGIFENRFGHSPYDICCECCGENYSVSESGSLEEASLYIRREGQSLEDYEKKENVLIIRKSEF